MNEAAPPAAAKPPVSRWAKVIDHEKCIGCHACSTACKSENLVPVGVNRTYVKAVDVGQHPNARRAFQVTRCNQCEAAPCTHACPTGAMHTRQDGIVDFDKSICIGCKACMAACPYDAIFINPHDHAAEKCNFCAHRLDVGLEPACVIVCPTEAILVGDLADPTSRVARAVSRQPVAVRRPEKETRPKLFYVGAHQATLDPLAARRPDGGLYMWSEEPRGEGVVPSGHAGKPSSSAAALLAWDVPHRAPWGPLVSLYTFTKGIASGAYLVAALLVVLGRLDGQSPLFTWAAPVLAVAFLALTGAILIGDLTMPLRFFMIFTRGRWQSWLVRGAVIISAYGLLLAAHVGVVVAGGSPTPLAAAGLPLAALCAMYTAWLFAQAKARDLWQSSLLAPHFLVQAALSGAGVLIFAAPLVAPEARQVLNQVLAVASAGHLLFALGEATMPHPTAHATLAARAMTRGRYARYFWPGLALAACGLATPALGFAAPLAALFAMLGVLCHEHAHVQAGQSVPLA